MTNDELLNALFPEGAALRQAIIKAINQNLPERRRESTVPNKTWRDGKCRVMRGIPRDPSRPIKRCKWCMSCPWIQPDGEIDHRVLEYCFMHPDELALHIMRRNYLDFGA